MPRFGRLLPPREVLPALTWPQECVEELLLSSNSLLCPAYVFVCMYVRTRPRAQTFRLPLSPSSAQKHFFRNITEILVFAFIGTFISTLVIGYVAHGLCSPVESLCPCSR